MYPNTMLGVLQPLAQSASANPLDVVKMKSALSELGHYQAPDWGLSQFPDPALFKAIQAFQRKRGLKVDGVMKPGGPTEASLRAALTPQQTGAALYAAAQTIQALGRNGDTVLAHITPAEAQLLDAITDGASVNPRTGLLEFWYDYEAHSYGIGDRAQNSGPDRGDHGGSDPAPETAGALGAATDTRATGGQDTLGGGKSITVVSPTKEEPSATSSDEAATARRSRTVLAPDNDPSFASGFFESKQRKEERKQAETEANERERQIWGEQQYWSEDDRPMSRDPKKDYPLSYARGTAENPERLKDSRIMGKVLTEYVEKKVVDRALTALFGALLARGALPLLMTKDQADMFGLNNDPI